MSILIDSVTPHTPAAKAGIRAGDRLVAVNGNLIHDVLDYRFYMIDTALTVEVERDSKPLTFHIKKEEYDELGLEFTDYLMDRQHHCANKCVFCFVDQLPKGMRETLYFKDDDSRMSFLFGSYVTLTNMTDEDIARIIKMHISPINISVHATNPELRVELMKNPRSGEVLKYIPQLAAHHIRINAQIVVCPGLNDGEELRRSLWDLGQYAPEVQSIALVPVGLTGHREGLYPLRMMEPEEAADCIRIADEFGEEMLRRHGSRIAFCADELYLIAGLPLPDYSYYEDFDQLGNGVGTTALLRDEFASALSMEDGDEEKSHFSLATCDTSCICIYYVASCGSFWKPQRKNSPTGSLPSTACPISPSAAASMSPALSAAGISSNISGINPSTRALSFRRSCCGTKRISSSMTPPPTMSPKHCKPPFMWPAWMALIS